MKGAQTETVCARVARALAEATDFITVDDICRAVYGTVGARERNTVQVSLHRMGDDVEKRPTGYRRKR